MELHRIRYGSKEALEAKEYNICVGISLGNRWFTPENVFGLIEWSIRYTKEYVVICPTDDIHAINLEVRNRRSRESALKLARKMSDELMTSVKELVESRLSESDKRKLIYATWADVADEEYKRKVDWLYAYFKDDQEFRDSIQNIVRGHTAREERKFSDEDIAVLSTYILEELPEVVGKVKVKGYLYEAYAYPFDSELTQFIEQIQLGEIFPEVRDNIIDTEPKVFLEVR